MIVRIFETDLDGNPVPMTGEFFRGTPSEIVEGMKGNPFQASLAEADFIADTLALIGAPPVDASGGKTPAEAFLDALVRHGYASYATEKELEMQASFEK